MPIDTTKCRSHRAEFVEWLAEYDLARQISLRIGWQ